MIPSATYRGKLAPAAILLLGAFLLVGCLSGSGGSDDEAPNPDEASGNNAPPKLSGSPQSSTKVGESWSFEPTASDPDGDSLTFSVQNEPGWTSFDSSNGTLSGTPEAGDEGSYANITIVASDGEETASLTFSVTVTQGGSGSMTLSWVPPTENTDGTILTDLAGYKIYYGKSPGNYTSDVQIDNPGLTTYVIDDLSPATYYVVATALNSSGVESSYSGVAVKTIN